MAVVNRPHAGILGFLKRRFLGEPPLHPIDRKLAKQWIKKRLIAVFPELRNDPDALEQAYQALNLEPRGKTPTGVASFELMAGREL